MPFFSESVGYFLSLPERSVRALGASIGGTIYEATEVMFPGWLRRSRFYEGLVVGTLRIAIEMVGGVRGVLPSDDMGIQEFTMRKAAGTGIEMAGFLTIGWSPIWLFAVVADLSGGTRAYLQELVTELQGEGMLPVDADVSSVEELLEALEGSSSIVAETLDVPPLSIEDMRSSWKEMKQHKDDLPNTARLNKMYHLLQATAEREDYTIQAMSSFIAAGALRAGINLGQTHVFDYYQDSLEMINTEGLPRYSHRVLKPYYFAARDHFDPKRISFTERLFQRR